MIKSLLDSKAATNNQQSTANQQTQPSPIQQVELENQEILDIRKEILATRKGASKSLMERSGTKGDGALSQEHLEDFEIAEDVKDDTNVHKETLLSKDMSFDIKRFSSPQINPITRHFSEVPRLEIDENDDELALILPTSQGRPLVIGVCGGNCSGKVDLVNHLVNKLGKKNCTIMKQENFFKNISEAEKNNFNFDDPEATDWNLMQEALNALLINNKPFHSPIYNFNLSQRELKSEELWPNQIIIIEGLLIFHFEGIRERLHLKIFLDTDDDIRLSKRILKDCIQLKRPLEQCVERYKKFVKPCHEQYVLPSKKYADIIIPNYGSSVCEHIEQMKANESENKGDKIKSKQKINVALELMIQQIKNELEIQQEVRQFKTTKRKFGI